MNYQTLHGSCACGRNRYVVEVPAGQAQLAELRYDNTNASRHASASPLTLWLRVPLAWFTSATFAQFPDETRTSIRRTFTSPSGSSTRRQFCGYCGTQLTSWNERTRDDADHICLTVGSLLDEDQDILGQLGYLPGDSSDEEMGLASRESAAVERYVRSPVARGTPWFEEIVENTKLGRLTKQRGGQASRDGNVRVEWEVVEYVEGDDVDDEGRLTPNKRKIDELGDDTEMTTV
ncbi:hypothetical protein GQ43DRAFT_79956 [Delitschia confertaspora ATCC 74209]|uniref:CENP-V/GFA domain-containing protein n=1 Tax=Delitschia confertaspora ATCC 74209 TaxID=1513339 RepID=A0A9P4JPL3_9PLEO|nr:hypothetical protein GQ43DRAFT_79956 [Delitschia confertaspora ATCC 74209]